MYIVLHIELVLNEVGIWIDGLMSIFRQLFCAQYLGRTVVVGTCCPRRTVAVGTAQLTRKQFLTTLDSLVVEVSGTWNGYTSVPNHERMVGIVAHFGLEVEVRIVVKVYIIARREQVSHSLFNAFARTITVVRVHIR